MNVAQRLSSAARFASAAAPRYASTSTKPAATNGVPMETQIEMPRYRSHKEVHALKIAAVEFHEDGSATIAPEDRRYAPLKTRAGWQDRFDGMDEDENTDLGYYVVYADGFTSWSPTVAFEDGYTAI